MINYQTIHKFCSEDISLIENYEEAVNSSETYDCHHRLETDLKLKQKDLIERDLYYNRPASELIFLTHAEHTRIHHTGKTISDEQKQKMHKSLKGRDVWNKGLKTGPLSEEHKQKQSKTFKKYLETHEHPSKGKKPWNAGGRTMYKNGEKQFVRRDDIQKYIENGWT